MVALPYRSTNFSMVKTFKSSLKHLPITALQIPIIFCINNKQEIIESQVLLLLSLNHSLCNLTCLQRKENWLILGIASTCKVLNLILILCLIINAARTHLGYSLLLLKIETATQPNLWELIYANKAELKQDPSSIPFIDSLSLSPICSLKDSSLVLILTSSMNKAYICQFIMI